MDGLMLNIDVTSDKTTKGSGKPGKPKPGIPKPGKLAKSTKKLNTKLAVTAKKVLPVAKPRKLAFIRTKSTKKTDTNVFSLSKHIHGKDEKNEQKNDSPLASKSDKNSVNDDPGFTVSFVKPKLHRTGENAQVHEKKSKKFVKGRKGKIPQILDRRKAFDFETQKTPFNRPSDKWFTGNPDREIRIDFPAKFKVKSSEKLKKWPDDAVQLDASDSKSSAAIEAKNAIIDDEMPQKASKIFPKTEPGGEKPRKPVKWSNTDYSKVSGSHYVPYASHDARKTSSKWLQNDTGPSRLGKFTGKSRSEAFYPGRSESSMDVTLPPPKTENLDLEFEPIEEELFSKKTFQEADVHPHLVGNLEQLFGIKHMTVVQQKTIPVLMSGKDALVRSQTGSGKTLAYAIPIMHNLQSHQPKLTRRDGIKALIVLPTRELATQTYECFVKLMRAFTWIVPGLIIGGEKRKSEKVRLRKGITVLIGTPGRLLDHAEHTSNLKLDNVSWLVIDEADRLLDMGYEEAVSKLIAKIDNQKQATDRWDTQMPRADSWENDWTDFGSKASDRRARAKNGPKSTDPGDGFGAFSTTEPKSEAVSSNEVSNQLTSSLKPSRQTVLLSATLTRGVERLAALALKNAVHVDAASEGSINDVFVIPQSLEQKYVVVPAKLRLVALASYIINVTQNKSKILIFMATQDMIDFYTTLLTCVLDTSKFYKLHGSMTQGDRSEVFNSFRKADKGGVLLSTDVAARGLNFPEVDWIVQFTAPTTPAEYVHRVGRTARVGKTGHALIFLLPSELHFISMLQSHRLQLQEVKIDSFLKSLLTIHLESKDGQWGGDLDGAAAVLQQNFEHAVLDDEALHLQGCNAYKSWIRFYATYPRELRIAFDFKALHLGHMAKSFALRDPPKTIGGIGKPTYVRRSQKKPGKRKAEGLGHVSEASRTKRLITSEFDSGIKQSKRPKFW
ncbi:ATP-dependent RNA helicase [Nesidiocoris tenuis]|uniref:ATP-dependent RNA helicase n=1 Tax=Nesidiocoris tenuis TaxID=355587 RepID=A0ABN7B9J3_9HEMI|nr:ATP-dependent RNA helicase [Nesidiocoris tenuis]